VGKLYVVSTPIGNLEDVSFRALRVLREVALIAAEDTRVTRKLLSRYDIHTRLVAYHQHNQRYQSGLVLRALEAGDVALVSDAGTPVLSDPGQDLIRTAIGLGIDVVAVPGPSAITHALTVAGLAAVMAAFLQQSLAPLDAEPGIDSLMLYVRGGKGKLLCADEIMQVERVLLF